MPTPLLLLMQVPAAIAGSYTFTDPRSTPEAAIHRTYSAIGNRRK